jgi:hypothetical protein
VKLTTHQLKQIIKEELESVLDEGLGDVDPDSWFEFYNGCMGQGIPQLDIKAGDKDRCMDVALQIQSGNYDDDVVIAYMKDQYAPKELSPKSSREVEQYIDDLPRKYEKERHRQKQLDRQRKKGKERAQAFQRASYNMVSRPRKRRR